MGEKTGIVTLYEQACGYRPGHTEKLQSISASDGYYYREDKLKNLSRLYNSHIPQGWMGGDFIVYNHSCDTCNACIPLRLITEDYQADRRERKTLKYNADLIVTEKPSRDSDEYKALYIRYIKARHRGTEPMKMFKEHMNMHSSVLEIRSPDEQKTLRAVVLFDAFDGGIAAHSYFFDPEFSDSRRSLGKFSILKLIEHAAQTRAGPIYLGYYVSGRNNLSYKKNFSNLETLSASGWVPFKPEIHTSGPPRGRIIPIFPA